MSKEGPTWEGLLKWSLSHTDGTQPSKTLRYVTVSLSIVW